MTSENKYEQICFCCLSEDGPMKNMLNEVFTFPDKKIKVQFVESYAVCIGIAQSEIDDTSSNICFNCESKLKESYEFRELCRNSFRIQKAKTDGLITEIKSEIESEYQVTEFCHDEKCFTQVYITEKDNSPSSIHRTTKPETTEAVTSEKLDTKKATKRIRLSKKLDVAAKRVKTTKESKKAEASITKTKAKKTKTTSSKQKSSERHKTSVKNESDDDSHFDNNDEIEWQGPSKAVKKVKLAITSDSNMNESNMEANYICFHCDKFLPTHDSYIVHRDSLHRGQGSLQIDRTCHICSVNVSAYVKHIENLHKDYKPNTCKMCPAKYQSQNNLKSHLSCHLNLKPTHECLACNVKFKKEFGLRKHLATTKHNDNLYHCPYCGLGHSQFVKLHEHFKSVHDAPKKIYPCFKCKKVYLVKRYYTDHECEPLSLELEKNPETKFASKCKRCFQEFFNEEEFVCHQYLQCEDDNNQCSLCDKSFETLQQLARHKRNHTYVHKSSVCDICGHTSVNESQMKNHKITHSDERPFKCLLCPAVFKLDYSLQSHQKMHREKKYECDICLKKFRDYHSIRLHMALHSDNTILRKYTCELCGRALVSTTALKRHIQTHTNERNVQCDLCPMTFRDNAVYNKHYRKVHEGLFYECKYCGKSIVEKEKFRNHLFIHRGFKPFNCAMCPAQFVPKYLYVKHLRVNHAVEFVQKIHGYRETEDINAIIQECMRIPFKKN